ncbi:ubiquitin homeostasis protein lub1 [Diplodia corticola]|uniref:Ubiquitin homeostasis protein lub1 n=1 Tax=Diplodia corticola TaxID=236234 RepID=A0A1J9R0Z9_9PEZI|nr:ubiquitin homeostasis protein lub1 [Diplodia corticola]OJD33914.1 ubiquitin homeostasis protein lub1 [Diplodia corticola]
MLPASVSLLPATTPSLRLRAARRPPESLSFKYCKTGCCLRGSNLASQGQQSGTGGHRRRLNPARLPGRGGRNRRQNPAQSFAHIQVVRREDDRHQPRNNHSYLNDTTTTDLSSPSFSRTGSENDITSLRTTLTRDTSSSSVVAPGHTFADMARTGGSKKNDPFAVRSTPSAVGLMKLKPKSKTKSIWKPFDLAEQETSDASVSPAPPETDASPDEVETHSAASSSHLFAPIRAPLGPPIEMAGSDAKEVKDEILEEFGHKLAEPVWLRSNTGKHDGELRFIQHPNRDVTAHFWSDEQFEWVEIGLYSVSRKLADGLITTDRYLEFLDKTDRRVKSLAYFTELVKGYPRFHTTHPPPLSSMKPTDAIQHRPALNLQTIPPEPARYDSPPTVSEALNDNRFLRLASLTLRDRPAAVPRPIATRGPSAPQGLGPPADDPFAADAQISPKSEVPSTSWPTNLRRTITEQDPGKMDFDFRFPSSISSLQRGEVTSSVADSDRKAFFAEQERSRAEKMRQSLAPTDREDRADTLQSKTNLIPLGGMAQFAPRVPSDRGPSFPGLGQSTNVASSSGLATSMTPTAKIPSGSLSIHQLQQLEQPNESRARMLDYLNRVGDEQLPTLPPAQGLRGIQQVDSAKKKVATADQFVQYEKPVSSGSQVSRSALRTSEPEPENCEDRNSSVCNSFGLGGPTPQNFNGPFLQDDMSTQSNSGAHRFTRKSREEELDEWWKSGLRTQRHDDFMKTLTRPGISGSSKDDFQVTDRLLVPLYETLTSYVRIPGEPPKSRDYFSRFAPPPEWAIDRSRAGNKSFFGEDWGETPRRIGRDPRFQPNFGLPKFTLFEDQHDDSTMRFPHGMRGGQAGPAYAPSPFYARKF